MTDTSYSKDYMVHESGSTPDSKAIACVTGASGIVGSKIVRLLILKGYKVRALSRNNIFDDPNIELFRGCLEDEEILKPFFRNACLLFHCAAELRDQSKMWDVNVIGTERVLRIVRKSNIRYLCYISSAGVVGRTDVKWVDEKIKCDPQDAYEQSKWAAEQLVAQGIDGCQIVILRPTNVIDNNHPGVLGLPMRNSWLDRIEVFFKGGECAHLLHAEDVAEAAMYFVSRPFTTPKCYFVSCDHEQFNTFAGLWSLYRAIKNDRPVYSMQPVLHLPLIIPYGMRKLWRDRGNRGDVRYSSEKLISEGFKFHLGIEGAVKKLISTPDSNGHENIKC